MQVRTEQYQEQNGNDMPSKEERRWSTREEYELAKSAKKDVYERDRKAAEEWYEKANDELIDSYGGGFVSQRVAIKMDTSLSDSEKELALERIEAKREKYYAERDKLAAKRDAMISDALRKMNTTFDPNYEYRKIGRNMTVQEQVVRVNPHYLDDYGYTINCQSCGFAFEWRMRGYDVEATNAPVSRGMGAESSLVYAFGDAEIRINGTGHENTTQVRNKMIEWGNGARGIISIDRSNGAGHIFNAAMIDGHFTIIDSQIGIVYDDREIGDKISGMALEEPTTIGVRVYRTDNKELQYSPDGWVKNRTIGDDNN